MFLRASSFAVLAASLLFVPFAAAQRIQTLHYAGTVGQQHVALSLELSDDTVTAGRYVYDTQKSSIKIVDSRLIGTTVVLQDEDGNILHLHFESAKGEKSGGWAEAAMLEGTLDRGDLDLPVKLTREAEPGVRPR